MAKTTNPLLMLDRKKLSFLQKELKLGTDISLITDYSASLLRMKLTIMAQKAGYLRIAKAIIKERSMDNCNWMDSKDPIEAYYQELFDNLKITETEFIKIIKLKGYLVEQKYDLLDGLNNGIDITPFMDPEYQSPQLAAIVESKIEGYYHPVLLRKDLYISLYNRENILSEVKSILTTTYFSDDDHQKLLSADLVNISRMRLRDIGRYVNIHEGYEFSHPTKLKPIMSIDEILDMSIPDERVHDTIDHLDDKDLKKYWKNPPLPIDLLRMIIQNNNRIKESSLECNLNYYRRKVSVATAVKLTSTVNNKSMKRLIVEALTDSRIKIAQIKKYTDESKFGSGSAYMMLNFIAKHYDSKIQLYKYIPDDLDYDQLRLWIETLNEKWPNVKEWGAKLFNAIRPFIKKETPESTIRLIKLCFSLQIPNEDVSIRRVINMIKSDLPLDKKALWICGHRPEFNVDLTPYMSLPQKKLELILFAKIFKIPVDVKKPINELRPQIIMSIVDKTREMDSKYANNPLWGKLTVSDFIHHLANMLHCNKRWFKSSSTSFLWDKDIVELLHVHGEKSIAEYLPEEYISKINAVSA